MKFRGRSIRQKSLSSADFSAPAFLPPSALLRHGKPHDFDGFPNRSDYGAPFIIEDVPVTVVLPDTLDDVTNAVGSPYFGTWTEDGEICFRRPAVQFEVSDANPVLTAKDGRLFYKVDMSPVPLDESIYGSEEDHLPLTLRDRLLCRCVKDMGEEKEVYEFFSEFGRIFVHVNSYMNGSEYTFRAMELLPMENGILERTDIDAFDAEIREFSDFAMAGTYTQPEMPYCRIAVKEDHVSIISLDEELNPLMDSGIELDKDYSQPSQFAVSEEDFSRVNADSPLYYPISYLYEPITSHILEGDGISVRLYRDGTFSILKDAADTTILYRGTLRTGSVKDDDDFRFVVKKLGGTAEPLAGRVHAEIEEGQVTFTAVEGYPCEPLIPEGTDRLVLHVQ